jgi:hypothetical protein
MSWFLLFMISAIFNLNLAVMYVQRVNMLSLRCRSDDDSKTLLLSVQLNTPPLFVFKRIFARLLSLYANM